MVSSVMTDKVEVRQSSTHKNGMFAKKDINKGEVVFIKGGHILQRSQIFSSGVVNSYHPIDDNYFLAARNHDEEEAIKLYINHSCRPNCGLRGEITFVSIRNIKANEELYIDYGLTDNEEYSFECECGESCCRSNITGKDWKIKDLQKNYFHYFAEYLKQKIINQK